MSNQHQNFRLGTIQQANFKISLVKRKSKKLMGCANSLKKATTLFNCNNGSAGKGWRTIQSGGPLFDVALQATTLFYDQHSDG